VRTQSSRARSQSTVNPLDRVGDQRVYHVTHVKNLPGILAAGSLYADANPLWAGDPAVDASSDETRSARRSIPIAGPEGATVAEYVPFFLSPNASLWQNMRSNIPDPRLSRAILGEDAADFVILVSTVANLTDAAPADAAVPFVVTDGDAAHVLTRFATTKDDADRALRRLRADQESEAPSIAQAELLVAHSVPLDRFALIGVAHDKARAVVKRVLADSGFAPKVAVYPPWFTSAD
jgi:hypothetical protein